MKSGNQKSKILLVDDMPVNIKMLKSILSADYQLYVAMNGPDALEIAAAKSIDLILLDIMMPVMNGYEVCKQLKARAITSDIPVIFVTAKDDSKDECKGLELGAIDYITKPFNLAIVKMRVHNHLELKHARDALRRLSNIDGLTGIPNRRNFDDYLEKIWCSALRSCANISMLMIDIDFFKLYNDNYGHVAGDECLQRVAASLAADGRRPSDLIARYGGEEFVCVLPDTDAKGLASIGESMRKSVVDLEIRHGHSLASEYVTISLGGITIIPGKNTSPADMVKAADENLYRAKDGGRNLLVCSSHVHPQELKILLVEDDESCKYLCQESILSWGVSVRLIIADNGMDALIKLGLEPPDVIITDIMMPEMDGVMMVNRIRENSVFKETRIIAISSLSEIDVKQYGTLPTDVFFFSKPIDFARLKELVLEKAVLPSVV